MKIPDRIDDMRFGQFMLNALQMSGHLKQETIYRNNGRDMEMHYVVTGTDLFYMESEQLTKILTEYHKFNKAMDEK